MEDIDSKKQIDKFKEMAKKLDCDESEKAFDEKLGKLAKRELRKNEESE